MAVEHKDLHQSAITAPRLPLLPLPLQPDSEHAFNGEADEQGTRLDDDVYEDEFFYQTSANPRLHRLMGAHVLGMEVSSGTRQVWQSSKEATCNLRGV